MTAQRHKNNICAQAYRTGGMCKANKHNKRKLNLFTNYQTGNSIQMTNTNEDLIISNTGIEMDQ